MKPKLLCLILIAISLSAFSEEQERSVTFSYWTEASPPFVISTDDNVHDINAGVIKDLAEAISLPLKATPKLIDLPVQRIEPHLQSGAVDIDCITNPMWKDKPDEYYWSPAIFKGADRLLVRKGREHDYAEFEDLEGKNLGVYNGYKYHSEIMNRIEAGEINAVKVLGIDHGIKLLLMDRIDILIDFDILLNFKIKADYSDDLALADLIAETYDLYCAYSKKMTFDKDQIDEIVNELVSSGEMDNILNRY